MFNNQQGNIDENEVVQQLREHGLRLNSAELTADERRDDLARLEASLASCDLASCDLASCDRGSCNRSKRHRLLWPALRAAAVVAVVAVSAFAIVRHLTSEGDSEHLAVVPAEADIVLMSSGGTMTFDDDLTLCVAEDGTMEAVHNGVKMLADADAAVDTLTLSVPNGRRAQLTLCDGTRLWVGSGSTVRFPQTFGSDGRSVEVDGEVYFDVAHNERAPFTVYSRDFDVRVTGTRFVVMDYSSEQHKGYVVLEQGSVNVSAEGDNLCRTLAPGQMLRQTEGGVQISAVDPYLYTSWKDGVLCLTGETMHEALQRIARHYAVSIECSRQVASKRLYGKLLLADSIGDVLDNINVICPIDVKVRNNTIIVK